MEGIKIPKELIEDIKRDSLNEVGPIGNADNEKHIQAIEKLTGVLTWGFSSFDSYATGRGLSGLGGMDAGELSELSALVLEKYAGDAILEKTPELVLGSLLAGIIASNVVAYKRLQKQAKPGDKKTESEKGAAE